MYTAEMENEKIIPIGSVIREELKRQRRSVTWLSSELHCDRRNIYDIFKRDNIDTTLLMRISNALGVDFFKIYSDALADPDVVKNQ